MRSKMLRSQSIQLEGYHIASDHQGSILGSATCEIPDGWERTNRFRFAMLTTRSESGPVPDTRIASNTPGARDRRFGHSDQRNRKPCTAFHSNAGIRRNRVRWREPSTF